MNHRIKRVRLGVLVVLGLALIVSIGFSVRGIATPLTTPVPPTPTTRPTDLGASLITKRAYPSLSYGVHAFLWWDPVTRPRDLENMRLLGFNYVKQIFDWNDVRADRSLPYNWTHADIVVNEANYRQIKIIARLGKPPHWVINTANDINTPPFDVEAFADFCGQLATRYKGKIAGYQVWNEPNLSREWADRPPSAAAYVKMLAACYKAIKAADPDGIVISAGLAPTGNNDETAMTDEQYLIDMYTAGASAYYDVLGLNAPGYKSPPETPPDDPALEGSRWQAFRHVEDMRAIMVAHGEGAKQIALLEVGWTTDTRDTIKDANGQQVPNLYRWHAVSREQQAQYLADAYLYAAQHWRPWVGLMVTIYIADPHWTPNDEEYWWSISEPGYSFMTRPAFIALAEMARYIDDQTIPARGPGDTHTPMPPPETNKR